MRKGIDIGGTFVKVLWEDGRKEKHFIKNIKDNKDRLLEKIRYIALEGSPSGVGIAVAGFTSKEGTVHRSPNIPVLDGVNMAEVLSGSEVKLVVGNDVSLASFGEWFFDYRDSNILLLVAVGTGLGGGLVVGGEPFFGACGSAMEVGHHIVSKGGYPCSCGRYGCWEAYCSSYGLQRLYGECGGDPSTNDYDIVKKALSGDRTALRAVEMFKEFLILGLTNMVHVLNPDRVVLGGGLIDVLSPLLTDLESKLKDSAESLPASCLSLSISKAGEFSGARGALAYISHSETDIKADGRKKD